MRINQGRTYDVLITLKLDEGTVITPDNVSAVEITLGGFKYNYPEGRVTYDDAWALRLEQEDTLRMAGVLPLAARVKTAGGDVIGADLGVVVVSEGHSREVL